MRVIQNLARKIPLTLQLRLIILQAGDIKHQSAILHDLAMRIRHGEGIDQHVNRAPILPAQNFFVIPQHALVLHHPI